MWANGAQHDRPLQWRCGSGRARRGRDRERDLHDARRAPGGARRRMNRRRAWIAAQLLFVVALVLFLGFALKGTWADAAPRLRDADPRDLLIATVLIAAYYCLFVVGWQWILRALDIRVSYAVALQSEMASMLAKYVPGGIWTPAARVVWLRKAGVDAATPLVLSSILLEAGLSAISGVGVFVAGIAIIGGADAPLLPLILFTAVVTFSQRAYSGPSAGSTCRSSRTAC